MSWLKLNDSLNKVKGQITSFAQEVLAEGIVEEQQDDDGQSNPVRDLHEAREKIGELTGLCATQDQEIATLRKQIAEYQQQRYQSKSPTELPSSSGSKLVSTRNGFSFWKNCLCLGFNRFLLSVHSGLFLSVSVSRIRNHRYLYLPNVTGGNQTSTIGTRMGSPRPRRHVHQELPA
ncbi:uncharacterized protein LOC134287891 [Aedes albopictus]|uniref:Uncharacterized protein n=1 Tax=Aedes albopictus TaxID=7160 RepID=A0ABM1ZDI7_AEDAL